MGVWRTPASYAYDGGETTTESEHEHLNI